MNRQSRTVALTLDEVRSHRTELQEIGRRHGVCNIRVFGSVARLEADDASDLDLLVEVLPGHGLLALSGFAGEVKDTLRVRTQVSTLNGLKAADARTHQCRGAAAVRTDQKRLRELLGADGQQT